jgi:hypothetical protein
MSTVSDHKANHVFSILEKAGRKNKMPRKLISAGTLLLLALALLSPPGHAAANGPSSQGVSTLDLLYVQVPLEGRPAAPSKLLIGTVYYHLTLGHVIDLYDKSTTDENGIFTIDVTGLPKGDYGLWVKNPMFLANATQVRLPDAVGETAVMEPLMAGDADNSNVVTAVDFNILKLTFGKSAGQPGYDARADFDGNSMIDIGDFQLLRNRFGAAGACEPGSARCS